MHQANLAASKCVQLIIKLYHHLVNIVRLPQEQEHFASFLPRSSGFSLIKISQLFCFRRHVLSGRKLNYVTAETFLHYAKTSTILLIPDLQKLSFMEYDEGIVLEISVISCSWLTKILSS